MFNLLPRAILLFTLLGCAKVSYIVEQGKGQWRLLSDAKKNQDVLADPTIGQNIKDKILLVEKYKKYFQDFWKSQSSDLYSETMLLPSDAVTYLVIASPWKKIEAHEECFWFVGCFPYLGFFDLTKAREHVNRLKEQDLVTFVRPVYAYSSLGHFDDPILSSFFRFDDVELANLVFHEMFHTIFFIKNEVNLNEALASYVAEKMLPLYFSTKDEKYIHYQKEEERDVVYKKLLVSMALQLKNHYQNAVDLTRERAQTLLDQFLEFEMRPALLTKCRELEGPNSECKLLQGEWNNARFVALLTYEEDQSIIGRVHEHLAKTGGAPLPLDVFVLKLREHHKIFKKTHARRLSFEEYLAQVVLQEQKHE